MTIEELMAEGEAKIKTAQIEQKERAAERARAGEEERLLRVGLFLSDVREAIDPALHPYLTIPEPVNEFDKFDPSDDCLALFRVAGCTDITVRFFKNWNMEHYQAASKASLIYRVAYPEWDSYEGLSWSTESFGDLSLALVAARNYQRNLDEMKTREEARQANAERQEREREAQQERWSNADAAQHEEKDRERQALVDLLSDDLVAFHLLCAFAGIQAERQAWQDSLESSQQEMEEIDAGHARRIEALEKRAQAAERDKADAILRECQARDDADRAERKLKKQAQRGG
jgi:hypothetical protein